ncbi:MAG: class I adenylate-forming enzyme family protein [Candidatus Binatia bacterium]
MERVHRHLEMTPPGTLIDIIGRSACERPGAGVFVGPTHRTWAEFDARTQRAAQVLRRLGLRRGGRAGILGRNCPEWLEVFCAVHAAGGVVVPVNERLTPGERRWLLADAGVTLLVGHADLLTETSFSGPTLAFGAGYENALATAPEQHCGVSIQPDDLAVIAYTSGTTGTPKGVMWSHRGLLSSAQCNPFPPDVAGGARVLVCAPLYAGGAIVMACNALAIGALLVVVPFSPEAILQTLADDHIEFTGLVPTMISLLVDAAPPGWRAPRLRRIYYGGGTMSPQLFARAQRLFACEFEQAYAMTETCILGTRLDPADHRLDRPERLASAGKPMPGVGLRIVGPDGSEVPTGTPGEILIRSPGNMLGYWRHREQDRLRPQNGWYGTRDIGRFDGDGYLYLVDRQDDMVKSGGLNVSPAEVEDVLTAHPGVAEAAVIGSPDVRWGERVTAVVRTRTGVALPADTLIAFCRSRLADFKAPRIIVFTDVPLPRTGLGKVSRQAVRKRYASRRAE